MEEVWEFYAPFAHLPGRLEWCRIHSPTHGVFDTCIVLGASTEAPATVYVRDDAGQEFLRDRFPECRAVRVGPDDLVLDASADGRRLDCRLLSTQGPLREATMTFTAQGEVPRQVPYGGQGRPVWGSRYTCWGIDLEFDAELYGLLRWEDRQEVMSGKTGILTAGSCGRLTPL